MAKSPDAFRTISEVADWLGVQAHVLRFWESKFAQVKPIKRAGGRRYYRPADMLLLGGIKQLLHDDGLTIKGTQKLLREKGVAYVADLSQPLDDLTMAVIEGDAEEVMQDVDFAPSDEQFDNLSDDSAPDVTPDLEDAEQLATEPVPAEDTENVDASETDQQFAPLPEVAEDESEPPAVENPEPESDTAVEPVLAEAADDAPWLEKSVAADGETDAPQQEMASGEAEAEETQMAPLDMDVSEAEVETEEDAPEAMPALPSFRARHRTPPQAAETVEASDSPEPEEEKEPAAPLDAEEADYAPAFAPDETAEDTEAEAEAPKRPAAVDVPPVPLPSEIDVAPSVLSMLASVRRLLPEHAREIKPHVARLTRLRASMANALTETHKD